MLSAPVPVLNDLDNIRNCPHCRQSPGDRNCRTWQEARKGVRTLRQEAQRLVRNVTKLRATTGGCTATIYQFLDGSVGYFAPAAPMWREAGEITGPDLAKALEILQRRGLLGGKAGWAPGQSGQSANPEGTSYIGITQHSGVEDLAHLAVSHAPGDDNVQVDAVGPEVFTYAQMVRLVRQKTDARCAVLPMWKPVTYAAGRVLGLLLGDIVLTMDEVRGLSRGLLVSRSGETPTCPTRLTEWLDQNSRDLGLAYANEVKRHYQ